MNDDRNKVETSEMLKVFWKSFLIQASWSYDHMQSLGFAYAIEPVLRKLYPDQVEYESRLRAHMQYFNTQPYLASFILGAVARMEQDRASGGNSSADISSLKIALMAPLGALGDSFFWGALKPFSAVVAVCLLMANAWWAPIVFLILYNMVHVGLRAEMLFHGFMSAGNAAELIARYNLTKMAKLFKAVSLTVLGGILGMLPSWRREFKIALPLPSAVSVLAGLLATILLVAILRRGGSPVKLMLGLASLCLALAYGGVI